MPTLDIGEETASTVADVTAAMRVWREEMFDPIATLTTYDSREEASALADDTVNGPSATISGNPAARAKVAPKLRPALVTSDSWSPHIVAPSAATNNWAMGGRTVNTC